MTTEPTGNELVALLAVARRALMDEVAPVVPAERRYPLLMIANALGIAAREVEAGDAGVQEPLARLLALYGETATEGEAPAAQLERLEARLAGEVRSGRYDAGADRAAVAAYLEARTRAKTAISNPRYLEAPA